MPIGKKVQTPKFFYRLPIFVIKESNCQNQGTEVKFENTDKTLEATDNCEFLEKLVSIRMFVQMVNSLPEQKKKKLPL